MAITYKKALKSIEVKTLGGTTVSVADTATETKASAPLAEFEAGRTMHIQTGENEVTLIIPFHAVDSIVVTSSKSDDITKVDPYCEEESQASDDSEDDGQ